MRKLLIAAAILSSIVVIAAFAGPASSGALLLLLPAPDSSEPHDLPEDYTPLHKGHVSLDNGLYYRDNEDLVVRGTPALILRRSYISSYRVPKELGVGTSHNGEWYLSGDGERFQWASLIRTGQSRINFTRVSPGRSYLNAMYQHRETAGEWEGARLGWTGRDWAIRTLDGALMRFRPCGAKGTRCAIHFYRDADGHSIEYQREASGRLLRMLANDGRWIAFDYDARGRVERARGSDKSEVWYDYDEGGRLERVELGDGRTHRYTYTDRDEMAGIIEPETHIENQYDASGRCIRQVNRYPDHEPYVFDFSYKTADDRVTEAESRRSDGTWVRYLFNENRHVISETWGEAGGTPATFGYERDEVNRVSALTLTCTDRRGGVVRRSSLVKPGRDEWIKYDLVRTYCAWTGKSWRTVE